MFLIPIVASCGRIDVESLIHDIEGDISDTGPKPGDAGDTDRDAGIDTDVDTDTESESDSGTTPAAIDSERDTGTDSERVTDPSGTDTSISDTDATETDSTGDTASDEDSETASGIDSETATENDSDLDTDTGSDSDSVFSGGTDTGSYTEVDTDTDADTETEVGSDTEVTGAVLSNRWRFNGTLSDEVGGSDAVIVTPDGAPGGDAVLSDSEITLTGGDGNNAEYISLGANLITGVGGPVTVEIWAVHILVQYYARIFEFGSSSTHQLIMTWTNDVWPDQDIVMWSVGEMLSAFDTNAPYELEEMYHIVMTIHPGAGQGNSLRIGWYSSPAASADMGAEKGFFETSDTLQQLNDSDGWLGKSHYPDDPVATASYDDVRIWDGILTPDDIETLHDLGPDGYNP